MTRRDSVIEGFYGEEMLRMVVENIVGHRDG